MFSTIWSGPAELSLFDLYNLELGAEIVSITGCGTGLRVGKEGDELVGLSRGLLYAGARSALVTLWNVEAESSGFLVGRFYDRWREEGTRKVEALYGAIRDTRKRYPHPFYWASFALTGAPDSA